MAAWPPSKGSSGTRLIRPRNRLTMASRKITKLMPAAPAWPPRRTTPSSDSTRFWSAALGGAADGRRRRAGVDRLDRVVDAAGGRARRRRPGAASRTRGWRTGTARRARRTGRCRRATWSPCRRTGCRRCRRPRSGPGGRVSEMLDDADEAPGAVRRAGSTGVATCVRVECCRRARTRRSTVPAGAAGERRGRTRRSRRPARRRPTTGLSPLCQRASAESPMPSASAQPMVGVRVTCCAVAIDDHVDRLAGVVLHDRAELLEVGDRLPGQADDPVAGLRPRPPRRRCPATVWLTDHLSWLAVPKPALRAKSSTNAMARFMNGPASTTRSRAQ